MLLAEGSPDCSEPRVSFNCKTGEINRWVKYNGVVTLTHEAMIDPPFSTSAFAMRQFRESPPTRLKHHETN